MSKNKKRKGSSILTTQVVDYLLQSGSSFCCFQHWSSDFIRSLIKAGLYEVTPGFDPDYDNLTLTPFGRRVVRSLQRSVNGAEAENVVRLKSAPSEHLHAKAEPIGETRSYLEANKARI